MFSMSTSLPYIFFYPLLFPSTKFLINLATELISTLLFLNLIVGVLIFIQQILNVTNAHRFRIILIILIVISLFGNIFLSLIFSFSTSSYSRLYSFILINYFSKVLLNYVIVKNVYFRYLSFS